MREKEENLIMKMTGVSVKKTVSVLLCVAMLMMNVLISPLGVGADTQSNADGYTAESTDNVIYVGNGGSTQNLSAAVSLAVSGARNIVVITSEISLGSMSSNMYSLGDKNQLDGSENVIITSYYNGVDYRENGAQINLCEGSSAGRYVVRCNLEFGHVKLVHKSKNDIFACMSKNVTFARGFENSFPDDTASYRPIIITGYDKQLTSTSSFSGTQSVCVESGEWQYIRGGDRRFTLNHGFTANSGETNIIINGGHFIATSESSTVAGAVSAHAQASTTEDASVYMEINGGTFEGPIYAYGYPALFSSAPTVAASVTVKINGGVFNNGKVHAMQCTDTSDSYYVKPTGKYTLIVTGGEFASADFVGMGEGSYAYFDDNFASASDFSGFESVKNTVSKITMNLPCAASALTGVYLDGDDVTQYAEITGTTVTVSVNSLSEKRMELVLTESLSCGETKHIYTVYGGELTGEYTVESDNEHFYLLKDGETAPSCINCGSTAAKTSCTECEYKYYYNKKTEQCFYKCKNCHTMADEILADENGPVVYYSSSAAAGGDGKSAATAYQMLGDAYAVLADAQSGGTIVMCGKSAPSDTVFPDAGGKVIFTSLYNSVNYRTSKYARMQIQDRLEFNNDVEFVYFDFATTGSVKYIIMNWHDLKITNARTMANYSSGSMTTTATTGRNIIIGGYYVPGDTLNSSAYDNMTADQSIYISGGVWLGIRGGNHRTSTTACFGRVSGNVEITLNGGTYNNSADSSSTLSEMGIEAAGQSRIIAPYTGSIRINGGTYKAINIYGQSRKGASYYTPNNEGNMLVTINGGNYTNCGIYSYNAESGTAAPSGEFIVDIKKQKTFAAIDGTMGECVTAYKENYTDADVYRDGISEIRMTKSMLSGIAFKNFDTVALTDSLEMFGYLGSALRTESSMGQGVREKFTLDRMYVENGTLGYDVAEFGILVRRAENGSVVYTQDNDSIRDIAVVKAFSDYAPAKLYSQDDASYVFTSVMTGIDEDAYTESFEYTPYARLSDGNGNYYVVYGEAILESAYSAAVKIEESGDAIPAYVAHILNTVRS